jgi:hypothetical protein
MRKFIVFSVVCVALLSCCHKVTKSAPVAAKPAIVAVAKDTTKAVVKDTTKAVAKETAKAPAKK